MNKIHQYINSILNDYINEGIGANDLMKYLNTDETNFNVIYDKLYKKLTLDDINFSSTELKEALIDNIQDKINFLKDLKRL